MKNTFEYNYVNVLKHTSFPKIKWNIWKLHIFTKFMIYLNFTFFKVLI